MRRNDAADRPVRGPIHGEARCAPCPHRDGAWEPKPGIPARSCGPCLGPFAASFDFKDIKDPAFGLVLPGTGRFHRSSTATPCFKPMDTGNTNCSHVDRSRCVVSSSIRVGSRIIDRQREKNGFRSPACPHPITKSYDLELYSIAIELNCHSIFQISYVNKFLAHTYEFP